MSDSKTYQYIGKVAKETLADIKDPERKAHRIAAAVLALYFAFTVVADSKMDYTFDIASRYPENFPSGFTWWDMPVFLAIAALSWLVLMLAASLISRLLSSLAARRKPEVDADLPFGCYLKKRKRRLLAIAGIVTACWLVVFLAYYPGSSMNDQIVIVDAPIDYLAVHPPLYVFCIWGFVAASNALFSDGNIGFAAFTICQMLACSAIISVCALWLRHKDAPKTAAALFVAFFALVPVVSDYAMTPLKDTPFSYSLLLAAPLMYEFASSRKTFWDSKSHVGAFMLVAVLIGLTRTNGVYIVCVMALVLFVFSAKNGNIVRFACSAVIAIAVSLLPGVVSDAMFDQHHRFSEALSVPLQQMSAVICADGTVPDEDAESLANIFNAEAVPRAYCPVFSDPVKLNLDETVISFDYIQDNKLDVLATWAHIGLANPDIYLRSWLAQTYVCWDPLSHNADQSVFFGLASNVPKGDPFTFGVAEKHNLRNAPIYPEPIESAFKWAYEKTVRCLSTGCLFLLDLVIAFCLAWRRKKPDYLLVVLPLFLLWGTLMLSTPLSGALRYGFAMLLTLPLLAMMLTIPGKGGQGVR